MEITLFANPTFGQVRALDQNGEVWFVAADVCKALEISNPTDTIRRLDDDERARFNLGRQGETNIVNEPGLYSLILGSRKPEAKSFKRWITHEVIPSIRQNGSYVSFDSATKKREEIAQRIAAQYESISKDWIELAKLYNGPSRDECVKNSDAAYKLSREALKQNLECMEAIFLLLEAAKRSPDKYKAVVMPTGQFKDKNPILWPFNWLVIQEEANELIKDHKHPIPIDSEIDVLKLL